MAVLIKSPNVEGKMLLLDPAERTPSVAAEGEAKVAAHEAGIKAIVKPTPQASTQSETIPAPPVATPLASATPESESEAYARFMAEHESLLKSLEGKIRREAHAAGYAEGEKAGYEVGLEKGTAEGAKKYEQVLIALERIADGGKEAVTAALAKAEALIGSIVFQSVCKIVGDVLVTPEGVQATVRQALADARRDEIVSLRVSPDDLRLLLEHEARLQPEFSRLQTIGLEADERISLGGCIVQLKGGHIDARIETQFRAFAQSLKDASQERT